MVYTKITRLEEQDIFSIPSLTPIDWGDITIGFRHYINAPYFYAIKLSFGKDLIGIGQIIFNGKTAWLGNIIVHKQYRKKGYGYQITQYLIDYALEQGVETIMLIATALGEKIYEKLGFQTQTYYVFLQPAKRLPVFNTPLVKPSYLDMNQQQQLFDLDYEVSAEKRTHLLEPYFSETLIMPSRQDEGIDGYLMPTLGNGHIVAKTEQAGLSLLRFKIAQFGGKLAIPIDNEVAIDLAKKIGYQEFRSVKRMILGKPIFWKPKCIFNRIGGHLG